VVMSLFFSRPAGVLYQKAVQSICCYVEPLFYIHHSNLDRICWLWQGTLPNLGVSRQTSITNGHRPRIFKRCLPAIHMFNYALVSFTRYLLMILWMNRVKGNTCKDIKPSRVNLQSFLQNPEDVFPSATSLICSMIQNSLLTFFN